VDAGGIVVAVPTDEQALDGPTAMPPPSNVDVCPAAAPVVMSPQPELAAGSGLIPGMLRSVGPGGVPTGPTVALGPMASGGALSSGGLVVPICASAPPQASRPAISTLVSKLVFMVRPRLVNVVPLAPPLPSHAGCVACAGWYGGLILWSEAGENPSN